MHRYASLFFKTSCLLSGIALVTTSFTTSSTQTDISPKEANRTENIQQTAVKETLADFRQVAKKAIPAVVSIKVQSKKASSPLKNNPDSHSFDFFGSEDLWEFFGIPKREGRQQPTGQASGVIVSPKGYILTNSHVVHDMENITILLHDGREFKGKVLGDDPNSDLALVQIEADNLPYLTLGNSDDLEVGQWVAAIGNPFGLQATLTVGVVSAKSRNNLDIANYEDFIQTDAAINRGNSGGPLVTLDGEVIGINTAIATTTSLGYVGVGFAVPSNMAKHVMEEILSDGKVSRGFLGVTLQSIDYHLAQAFGLKKVGGALVTSVAKNSAAEKGGLQVEDIILRYNDRSIENSAALRNAVYMMKPGSQIVLTVLRKDQEIKVPLVVGDYTQPIEQEEKASISEIVPASNNVLGIEVENLTPEIAKAQKYTQEQGVVITRITPSSAANLAGLKKGTLIMGVNRQKVTNVQEFQTALAKAPKGSPILLQIKQGTLTLFVSIQTSN